jgi:hypothetical protein
LGLAQLLLQIALPLEQRVEFGQKAKSCVVGDPAAQGAFILPDDWYEHANGEIVRG